MAGLDPFVRFGVAMAREVLALRAALRDVCEAAEWRDDTHWQHCVICDEMCRPDVAPFRHAPDCPVAAALALLEEGA